MHSSVRGRRRGMRRRGIRIWRKKRGKVSKSKIAEHSYSTAPTFADDSTFSNVYLYPTCTPLLQMYICAQCTPLTSLVQMYICTPMYPTCTPLTPLLVMYIMTKVNGVNLSCLSIFNVPASTKQATFPLYSVALMMKKMMNLINFLLR